MIDINIEAFDHCMLELLVSGWRDSKRAEVQVRVRDEAVKIIAREGRSFVPTFKGHADRRFSAQKTG